MDIHVCKQCGSQFVYCRACTFRPVRYKDAGFCSKECYEASKNVVAPVVAPEVIEDVIVEETKLTDEITEDAKSIGVEMPDEIETEETIAVEEPTVNKETNAYKKKKNKYQVHE